MEGGAFRRDYELVEVTGVTGADDLADLLVGVVGEDVVTDAVSVDDRSLEPGQSRLAVVRLHPEVERDLVGPGIGWNQTRSPDVSRIISPGVAPGGNAWPPRRTSWVGRQRVPWERRRYSQASARARGAPELR